MPPVVYALSGLTTCLCAGPGANACNNSATFLLGFDTNCGKNILLSDYFHTITHQFGMYAGD